MALSDEHYMQLAIDLAKEAKASSNFPFGSIIVRRGQVVATGKCEEISGCDVVKHAELLAVSNACRKLGTRDLSSCMLYATGEPCNMCAAAIFQAGIGRVVIGMRRSDRKDFFRERKIGIAELASDSGHQIELVFGVLKNDVIDLFADITK